MEEERWNSGMRGTKNQEGVLFKMMRDLGIIFVKKKSQPMEMVYVSWE